MVVKHLTDTINHHQIMSRLFKRLVVYVDKNSAKNKFRLFQNYLGHKVLDIGLGTGSISQLLLEGNHDVHNLDISNTSIYSHIVPTLYDGSHFPYKNKEFDTGIIICVLHHCSNQEAVLQEAVRTCKKLIILEDTFRNSFERFFVSIRDMVGNFEFFDHHYRKTEDWMSLLSSLGCQARVLKEWTNFSLYGMYGRQTLFLVSPQKTKTK